MSRRAPTPTVAETRRQREYEERGLAGREWYGVPLDAPVRAGEGAATFADWILRDPATQERAVTRDQVAALIDRLMSDKQRAILPLHLAGHSSLAISRQTGIPWTTVKNNLASLVTKVRRALGLEPPPARKPGGQRRLTDAQRRHHKALQTIRRQKRNQAAGRCRCGGARVEGHRECQRCRDRRTILRRATRAQGLCRECRTPLGVHRTYCDECLRLRAVRERVQRGTTDATAHIWTRGGGQGFSLRFPPEEWEALDAYCAQRRVTKANLIRAAVRRHLKEQAA